MPLSLIRVVIVEDQPDIRSDIQFLVERQNGFSVAGSCGTVKEARQLISQIKPDLLLLDIHLADGTGFDVLREAPNEFKVIFLTAFEKHAIQAIKFGALDYLLKPIDEIEFTQALNKVSQYFPAKSEQLNIASSYHKEGVRSRLVLRSQEYFQIVEISEIIYCHSDAGYTSFFLYDGKKILTSKILKDYEDLLTEPFFIRPHQSYMVNCQYIEKYRKDGLLVLKNGVEIPVAQRRKDAVLDFLYNL